MENNNILNTNSQNNIMQTNTITLSGRIVSDFTFSHQVYGEAFYTFMLECKRLSESADLLPVTISERLLIDDSVKNGDTVSINGQLRSYNSYSDEKAHLILTVFAREIEKVDGLSANNPNSINLNGYICKKPIYRTTPFGREITDILLAVNRAYNKSDYIPIICWGRNARFAASLEVGTNISVTGRMQSRSYQKKIDEENVVQKTAYEVSVSKIELLPMDGALNNIIPTPQHRDVAVDNHIVC
jgi:single-stranded DNA-binding protein